MKYNSIRIFLKINIFYYIEDISSTSYANTVKGRYKNRCNCW
jgi:hypothetical protein